MTTLNHLDDDARKLMDLTKEQRAQHMILDRFITHERLSPILEHAKFLRFAPIQSRASGLVVYGPPGSGKTMLARSILRRHGRQTATPVSASTRPTLMISMTGAREANILFNRLLTALDCPQSTHSTGADRERLTLRLCKAADVRMIIVDEIQDILSSTARQQRIALDTVKFLMNELSVPILVLGTLAAKQAMEVDAHLNARFKYRELPTWKADSFLGNFLDTLEMRLPLAKRSALSSPTLMKELVKVSDGVLHGIVQTTCYAAAHAVEDGTERITKELIEYASYYPPLAAVRPPPPPPVTPAPDAEAA